MGRKKLKDRIDIFSYKFQNFCKRYNNCTKPANPLYKPLCGVWGKRWVDRELTPKAVLEIKSPPECWRILKIMV